MWCNVWWGGGGNADGGCQVWADRERNEKEAGWSHVERGGEVVMAGAVIWMNSIRMGMVKGIICVVI